MKFAPSIDSSFHERFLCSMRFCLVTFCIQWNFIQNRSQSSQALPLLYQLSLYHILNLCHFNNLYSIFPRSWFYLNKRLSVLIRKKWLLIRSSFIMRLQQFKIIIMNKFEIVQGLPKWDTEIWSEQMLLEKWCWVARCRVAINLWFVRSAKSEAQ